MNRNPTIERTLLSVAEASLKRRLARRTQLVRHDPGLRSALFRAEVYDVSQATPLYWMWLRAHGDRDAEEKLVTGLQSLAANLRPPDHNAGFRALFLLATLHFQGGACAPMTQGLLRDALRAAIRTCLDRGKRAVWFEIAYTNFWMIEAAVYTLGGALLGDRPLRRKGERMLRDMHRAHSRLDAMDEFFSPTYIVVDLVAAGILKAAAPTKALRRLAREMEAHFLRHLERHVDLRACRWVGPYSRAYPADLRQTGSLLNLFLYRATGNARWLRGKFGSEGAWGIILALLDFPALRPRAATRELALSHPRSPYEQRRCVLTVHRGRRYAVASASAYREWAQTHPLTVHAGDATMAVKSLTLGHFVSAQCGNLVLAAHRPVCTLGGGGRDDMRADTVDLTGVEILGGPWTRESSRLGWTRWRRRGVTVWLLPVLLPEGASPFRAAGRFGWRRRWHKAQRANVAFLSRHAWALALFVSDSGDEPPAVRVTRDGDRLHLRAGTLCLRFSTRALQADHWTSSGWACRDGLSRPHP